MHRPWRVARRAPVLKELLTARGFSTASERPRLVILGTGWAGFRLLSDIDATKFDVAVVSPRNHLLFTPMLASSALGTVNQRSICQPVRPVVSKKQASYYESKVTAVDKENKVVVCEANRGGQEYKIPYDKLVVAVGFQPNDFNTKGVKEHALFMKETMDATKFKDHILEKLEEASYWHALDSDLEVSAEEERKIKSLLTFVIVGGGPTGVELAGELTDFLMNEGKQQYGHVKDFIKVHMITYDVLAPFDKELQEYAIGHLAKKQGVEVHLGAFVKEVGKDFVTAKMSNDEMVTYECGTIVWCAGIKPHKFIKDFNCPMNERGSQILVDGMLRVKGEADIYALGDCATIENYWLPQTAQVANQQAQYLAKHLNARTKDQFEFKSKGMMAYLGGYNAIMSKLPGMNRITGFMAFMGWRFTYWFLQLSFRNRYMLSTDWLRTIIFGRDLTRFGPASKPD